MRVEHFGHIDAGLGDELLELDDLAHFLEGEDLVLLVAIDSQTRRVIASVFKAGQS